MIIIQITDDRDNVNHASTMHYFDFCYHRNIEILWPKKF